MQTHHIANRQSKDSSKIIFSENLLNNVYCSLKLLTDFKRIYADMKNYWKNIHQAYFLRIYWSNEKKRKIGSGIWYQQFSMLLNSFSIFTFLTFIHIFISLIVFLSFTFHQDSHLYIISQSIKLFVWNRGCTVYLWL